MSKTHPGHYCKICGLIRPNEKFSGKGHANHICKDCSKLPAEKKTALMTINRLYDLPYHMSRDQRAWLERCRKDHRDDVREAAESVFNMRFPDDT